MSIQLNSKAPAVVGGSLDEKQQTTSLCPKDGGLWDIPELMRHLPLCRRSISNLRKKGLPTIKLGSRVFFHPASVENWLMRQERGGE